MSELEAEVARLEQELTAVDADEGKASPVTSPLRDTGIDQSPMNSERRPGSYASFNDEDIMEMLAGNAPPESPQTQSLIEHLFSRDDSKERQSIQSLIDDIGKASLSAIVVPETSSSQDFYLRTLILNATLPVHKVTHNADLTKSLHLPQQSIAERVFLKYRHVVLPDLTFMSEDSVLRHLRATYSNSDTPEHYSMFVTALMLATTAVHISPGSVLQASGLYRAAVIHLETAFGSEPQSVDPLRDLEAVIGLAFFAALAGDDYSDAWALSGIAMRICIDLGLHKFADTEQKRRLFWSAFALDRKIAVARNLPVGLSDKSISAEVRICLLILDLHFLNPRAFSGALTVATLVSSSLLRHFILSNSTRFSRNSTAQEADARLLNTVIWPCSSTNGCKLAGLRDNYRGISNKI